MPDERDLRGKSVPRKSVIQRRESIPCRSCFEKAHPFRLPTAGASLRLIGSYSRSTLRASAMQGLAGRGPGRRADERAPWHEHRSETRLVLPIAVLFGPGAEHPVSRDGAILLIARRISDARDMAYSRDSSTGELSFQLLQIFQEGQVRIRFLPQLKKVVHQFHGLIFLPLTLIQLRQNVMRAQPVLLRFKSETCFLLGDELLIVNNRRSGSIRAERRRGQVCCR